MTTITMIASHMGYLWSAWHVGLLEYVFLIILTGPNPTFYKFFLFELQNKLIQCLSKHFKLNWCSEIGLATWYCGPWTRILHFCSSFWYHNSIRTSILSVFPILFQATWHIQIIPGDIWSIRGIFLIL